MNDIDVAEQVLEAVGGKDNVRANDICMTRLRIMTANPELIDRDQLDGIPGVLGYAERGSNGIEIVFGPGSVSGVHDALVMLTGIEDNISPFLGTNSKSPTPIRVRISSHAPTPDALRQYAREARADDPFAPGKDEVEDVANLVSMLDGADEDETDADEPARDGGRRVLVLNGPNINMLGVREPHIYGRRTYEDLVGICKDAAREAGFVDSRCFQSNHEGDLVDAIQVALEEFDGIVINPAAYTHTSVALLDALKAVSLPCVEVHISNLDEREDFRRESYVRAACIETVAGMGLEGYRKAIFDLWDYLEGNAPLADD